MIVINNENIHYLQPYLKFIPNFWLHLTHSGESDNDKVEWWCEIIMSLISIGLQNSHIAVVSGESFPQQLAQPALLYTGVFLQEGTTQLLHLRSQLLLHRLLHGCEHQTSQHNEKQVAENQACKCINLAEQSEWRHKLGHCWFWLLCFSTPCNQILKAS